MKSHKGFIKFFIIFLLILLILGGIFYFWSKERNKKVEIKLGNSYLQVEIANTITKRERGLSLRKNLPENEGMLFIFKDSKTRSFWMKNMEFSVDIIWIDENLKVVGIERNISPATFPDKFESPKPVKYVLEVNANWAEKNKIKVGDKLDFLGKKYEAK